MLHTYMQHHASLSCQVEIYLSAVEDARIEPKVFHIISCGLKAHSESEHASASQIILDRIDTLQ